MSVSGESRADAPKLEVEHLFKVFGPHPRAALAAIQEKDGTAPALRRHTVAVNDVSFSVGAGETFVVMGLSGSGKSTLARCINRLINPTDGVVRIDGENIVAFDERRLREVRRHKVAMVFQSFGLLPHRTVLDNVALGLEIQGVRRAERWERARAVLEVVHLGDWAEHYPDQLSGGMQQRVGLARALTTDPDILLMDEPFSALDPLIRRAMQDELLDIQERLKKTIVFITHDLDEALRLGNRVAIMKAGRMVQIGAPEEILLHPADDYVSSFVQHVDRSKVLRARDVMIAPRSVLRLGQSPRVALLEMEKQGLSSAFVIGPAGRLRGLCRADDAVTAAQRGDADLTGVLDTEILTAAPDQSLRDLIPLAAVTQYPLAVIDDDRRLLGIVARVAILRALVVEADEAAEVSIASRAEAAQEVVAAP